MKNELNIKLELNWRIEEKWDIKFDKIIENINEIKNSPEKATSQIYEITVWDEKFYRIWNWIFDKNWEPLVNSVDILETQEWKKFQSRFYEVGNKIYYTWISETSLTIE